MTENVTKTATEDADWSFDLTEELGEDAVASFAYDIFPVGLTAHTPGNTGTGVSLWFSGGEKGRSYSVPILITTTGGRKLPVNVTVFVLP